MDWASRIASKPEVLRVSATMKLREKHTWGFAVFAAAMTLGRVSAVAAEADRFLDRATAQVSVTATSQLRGGAGEVGVTRAEVDAGGVTQVGANARLTHHLVWVRTELDREGENLLPPTLQEISLRLGWQQNLGRQWQLRVMGRPGFFGDSSRARSATFNVPVLALASYATSQELAWSFGFVANTFDENPVLPVAGVRWEWAPGWTLNVGLPRAGVEWQVNQGFTAAVGATVQGGAYRVNARPAAGIPPADTKLDYREIRVGAAVTWKLNSTLSLIGELGMAVDQRFEYHQWGLNYRGSDEMFGTVALSSRF